MRATGVRLDWARAGLVRGPLGLGLGSGWNGSRRGCGWVWAGLEWDRWGWVRVGAGLEWGPLERSRWSGAAGAALGGSGGRWGWAGLECGFLGVTQAGVAEPGLALEGGC